MPNFRLDRRTLLRGAGSVAIALPWLEIMAPERQARAQTQANVAKRFLAVFTPGGTVIDDSIPGGRDSRIYVTRIYATLLRSLSYMPRFCRADWFFYRALSVPTKPRVAQPYVASTSTSSRT